MFPNLNVIDANSQLTILSSFLHRGLQIDLHVKKTAARSQVEQVA